MSPGNLKLETLRLSLACDWDGWQQPEGILKLCLIDPHESAAVFIAADGTRQFTGSSSTAAPEVLFFELNYLYFYSLLDFFCASYRFSRLSVLNSGSG